MIIWLNGAFGSGKTQTALELQRRLSPSYIFDPENGGFYIRDNIPSQIAADDFQKHPIWRELTYSMLKYIDSNYDGTIIVPMTLVNSDYFEEIVGRLRKEGRLIRHFTLSASPETLYSRLVSRGEDRNSWAAVQMERCLRGLEDGGFGHYVDTEHKSIAQVAEKIISLLETKE